MLRFFCLACLVHAFIIIHVSGTSMTFSQSPVSLNKVPSRDITMTCALTTVEQSTEVKQLSTMLITRHSARESNNNDGVVIAIVFAGGDAELGTAAQDIIQRSPIVTGRLQKDGPRNTGELTLTWNSSQIQCQDAGMYVCDVTYTANSLVPSKFTGSGNLTTSKYPEKVDMQYMDAFMQDVTDTTTITRYENNVVEMSCTAHIGSDDNRKIEWYQTPRFRNPGNTDGLQKFAPSPNDVLDPGTPSDTMTDCSYSLTSNLKYNITALDRERTEPMQFECRVEYSLPGTNGIEASKRLTISVENPDDGGGNTGEVASAGGSDVGIIAGVIVGVLALIVLVVLLLYFLWYRKRKGGETYRTKEENGGSNPNLAPETTTYATPQKDRKGGFENDGLDEPHQDRSRTRNNYRDRDQDRNHDVWDHRDGRDRGGRANHGMDREQDSDSSPSMTPRMNHMGSDPQENFGTGV